MAIKPAIKYQGRATPASDAYPLGSARDITTTGDGTGTPLQKDWLNDIWGFLQALLAEGGVTASGSPDTAQASQYLAALKNHSARYYATRALLAANTNAQYSVGQTIEVAGVKWTVETGTANGMDILQLPGGKVARYAPGAEGVHAAALGMGEVSDGAAIFNRCVTLAAPYNRVIILPAGLQLAMSPVVIPAGYSVISDTPGVPVTISNFATSTSPMMSVSGDGVYLRDIRFFGAGDMIGTTADTTGFRGDSLAFESATSCINFGEWVTKQVYLNSLRITDCAFGIRGTQVQGLVVQGMVATAALVGGSESIGIDCTAGYIQWDSHNTTVSLRSGSVTLVPGVLGADSGVPVLKVFMGAEPLVLCKPTLVGLATVDIPVPNATGFVDKDFITRADGYALTRAHRIEDEADTEASYYGSDSVRLRAGHGGVEMLMLSTAGTIFNKDLAIHEGTLVIPNPTVPAGPRAMGRTGQIAWGHGYIYLCTAPDTWKRLPMDTW